MELFGRWGLVTSMHNPYTEFHIKKIRHVVKCHGGSVLCEEHEGNMNSALYQKIIKAIAY